MDCPKCKEKGYNLPMTLMAYTWGGVKIQIPYYKCLRCAKEIRTSEDSSEPVA